MNAGAEDPNCGIDSLPFIDPKTVIGVCDYGSQKRLSCLGYMRKSYGPFSPLYRLELARDWFGRCDALQKFRRFFHRKLYAKSYRIVAGSL